MEILISTCFQGFIYAVLALGVHVTFRILNFADMTAEGSLALGGSVCAVLIANGMNPWLSTIIAAVVSSTAGLITGILHTKLKIQAILSGILTMIALYSVNIRIMGKANVSLLGKDNIFKSFENAIGFEDFTQISSLLLSGLILVGIVLMLSLFFKTRLGLSIRATGDNEQMMRAYGANTDFKKILSLMLSNLICGLSGALIAQNQGYSDVNMGTGTIVIALSSIVIGETFIKREKFCFRALSVIFGSVIYRFVVLTVLTLGMNPSDLKLFTALVAAILLALPEVKKILKRGVKDVRG